MEARTPDTTERDAYTRTELKRAIEAILFAAEEAVDAERLVRVFTDVTGFDTVSRDDVVSAVDELNTEYAVSGRSLRIRNWAGGFRLTTDQEVAGYVKAYFEADRAQRLSRTLLETLAIVAYRQPVTRPEIDFVRGVDSDYAVRKLMELRLVDVVGRSEAVGRPLLYGTTPHFLEQFGLPDLEALPTLREVEEILNDPAFNRERARLLALEEQEQAIEKVEGEISMESHQNDQNGAEAEQGG